MNQENPESLIFRRPVAEDAAHVLELLIRCDIAEYGDPDSEIEDLEHEWGQIDLQRDAWLVYSPGAELIGYAAVLPYGQDMRYDFYVDPSWEGESLGLALLARCEERGPAFAREQGISGEKLALAYAAHVNQRDRAVLEGAGFEPGISADDESYNKLQGKQRQLWLDLFYELSMEQSIIGASRHLLYIGKKTA
jgi:GNAT superfamily N-acetyltransferase